MDDVQGFLPIQVVHSREDRPVTTSEKPKSSHDAGSPLDAILSAALGWRVRGLQLEIRHGKLYLRGRTDTYYIKQLAQHTAMEMTELPLAVNEIEVISNRQVLLATGDDFLQEIARGRLTREGWDVATAKDGIECLTHIRRHTPDVVVLDASLLWGGADGILADMADGSLPNIPVVLMGNLPRPTNTIQGIIEVLGKPICANNLAIAVANAVDGLTAEKR